MPNFSKAQDAATQLLLLQDISSLYIDIRNFKFDRPIIIDSIQNYCRIVNRPVSDFVCKQFHGCGLIKHPSGYNLILYDENETNQERKHWGIVHEVGHVYCDHGQDGKIEEIEAHFFAAQIVMPEIVLYEIAKVQGGISAHDIYAYFNASYTSCNKRINTLRKRNRYSCGEIDRSLLQKFTPIIEEEIIVIPTDYEMNL